jgi:hypothetical protein
LAYANFPNKGRAGVGNDIFNISASIVFGICADRVVYQSRRQHYTILNFGGDFMDLSVAIMFLHLGLIVLFIVLAQTSNKKIYNLLATGVIISLIIGYLKASVPLIIVCVGLILWLLFDTFYLGGKDL